MTHSFFKLSAVTAALVASFIVIPQADAHRPLLRAAHRAAYHCTGGCSVSAYGPYGGSYKASVKTTHNGNKTTVKYNAKVKGPYGNSRSVKRSVTVYH